ncbi:hypothetical protein UFOVP609_12 [uncultured Caudovirales phage]|uniref:Uncharacterized protein n=1 Tax=uncultured Caudovirales phage TaxID=2100421 RepID=A0A6J5N398_9CAUD|nr:hypothetical protein UFOVP609_12 [uncultured Caudovirales phage]
MAKARVYVKLDSAGIAEFMKSSELGVFLEGVAEGIADKAGEGHTVVVDFERRKSRVISMVESDDLGREISTGALARAVGAKEQSWL